MSKAAHFRQLERMYLSSPIDDYYQASMDVSEGAATVAIKVHEKMFHAANALHGSVYFKLLDDAAFFTVNSLEPTYFVLTASFTTELSKPVTAGTLKATGNVIQTHERKWEAESIIFNDGTEVGRGRGIFVRSKLPLASARGYSE